MGEDAVASEEARHDQFPSASACASAGFEEGQVQVRGDDAQLGTEFEEVPLVSAKDLDRPGVLSGQQRVVLSVHQPDEGGLPTAVGPENGCVLSLPDLEAQVMENGPAAPDHRRVVQGE